MKKTLILAISALFLMGCNSSSEQSQTDEETITQDEHSYEIDSEGLVSNNGEKWIVNDEMKPFVKHGEELANSFTPTNEANYEDLAKSIKEQNDLLIKNCTMEGKSHDELHKWLHPHMELVDQLEKEEDAEKAATVLNEIKKSYKQYHEYFN